MCAAIATLCEGLSLSHDITSDDAEAHCSSPGGIVHGDGVGRKMHLQQKMKWLAWEMLDPAGLGSDLVIAGLQNRLQSP